MKKMYISYSKFIESIPEQITETVNYLHYIEQPAIKGVNKNNVINLVTDPEISEMFFREPTPDDIKTLNKFLNKNKYNMIELYHGTSNDIDILNNGLLTTKLKTKKSIQSRIGYVYLSIHDSMARTFGKMAYPHNDTNVYKITVPIYFLKPDEDQLKNVRMWKNIDCGNTLADSALYGSGFAIKGNIPPYMIEKHHIK